MQDFIKKGVGEFGKFVVVKISTTTHYFDLVKAITVEGEMFGLQSWNTFLGEATYACDIKVAICSPQGKLIKGL